MPGRDAGLQGETLRPRLSNWLGTPECSQAARLDMEMVLPTAQYAFKMLAGMDPCSKTSAGLTWGTLQEVPYHHLPFASHRLRF